MSKIEKRLSIEQIEDRCPDWVKDRIIFSGYRGSDAHGTKIEGHPNATDDVDVFAITCQDPEWYLSLEGYTNKKRQVFTTDGEELDILVYDIRKYIHLLAKGNPNVIFFPWLPEEDLFYVDPSVDFNLIGMRDIFLTKKVLRSLLGYAEGQLQQIERTKYKGYMGQKRKELVDRYGYDIKHAAHCYRLLQTAGYLAETGTLYPKLPEKIRDIIIRIKKGCVDHTAFNIQIKWLFSSVEDSVKNSTLPEETDYNEVNRILSDIICDWGGIY